MIAIQGQPVSYQVLINVESIRMRHMAKAERERRRTDNEAKEAWFRQLVGDQNSTEEMRRYNELRRRICALGRTVLDHSSAPATIQHQSTFAYMRGTVQRTYEVNHELKLAPPTDIEPTYLWLQASVAYLRRNDKRAERLGLITLKVSDSRVSIELFRHMRRHAPDLKMDMDLQNDSQPLGDDERALGAAALALLAQLGENGNDQVHAAPDAG